MFTTHRETAYAKATGEDRSSTSCSRGGAVLLFWANPAATHSTTVVLGNLTCSATSVRHCLAFNCKL